MAHLHLIFVRQVNLRVCFSVGVGTISGSGVLGLGVGMRRGCGDAKCIGGGAGMLLYEAGGAGIPS